MEWFIACCTLLGIVGFIADAAKKTNHDWHETKRQENALKALKEEAERQHERFLLAPGDERN